jgi:glycine/D-amino acid oxidase-like deaminating enzyme
VPLDYLIVGQGLAGSVLACVLRMQGRNIAVVDNAHRTAASVSAAGIINPITGKRLTRPFLIDTLLEAAFSAYPRLERFLGSSFFQKRTVLRLLQSAAEQKQWHERLVSGEYNAYLGTKAPQQNPSIRNRFGGFEISAAGHLDIPELLRATRQWLVSEDRLITGEFDYSDLRITDRNLTWRDLSTNIVIFCEGYQLSRNPFFNTIKLNPAKGELLVLQAPQFDEPCILQHGKWLFRTITGEIKAGTTYSWEQLNEEPTPEARAEIESAIRQFIRIDFQVIRQSAGVRPVIKVDNRPIVGVHPDQPRLAVLNGLGSKGALQAPFAANQLIAYLERGTPVHPEFDVCRKSLW